MNAIWGFKPAVLISIALVFGEFIILKYKKIKISSFFYFSSGLIIVFGLADLMIQEPFFFKFEAMFTNLFFAVFFALSLFKEKSITQEFAEMQNKISEVSSADKKYFFRLFTLFWCTYFVAKAFFYLWVNLNTSLSEGLLIRVIVGKVSFWIMMFISVGLPRKIWKLMESYKMFPSQKGQV